jgi:hypothetical protein
MLTGLFVLKEHEVPDANEIRNTMTQQNKVDGFTCEEIAQRFPGCVWFRWSQERLEGEANDFAYLDKAEQRYFPSCASKNGNDAEDKTLVESVERGTTHQEKLRHEKRSTPETVKREYLWDRSNKKYVRRPQRLQRGTITEVQTRHVELRSPTVASTRDGASAPEPQNTLQSGIDATRQTTPIEPTAASPVGSPAAGCAIAPANSPPAPAVPRKESAGRRPPKRAATEPPKEVKGTNNARKPPKVQCSGTTL